MTFVLFSLQCRYCGHAWTRLMQEGSAADLTCIKAGCGSHDVEVKAGGKRVDTYGGSPPFPPNGNKGGSCPPGSLL